MASYDDTATVSGSIVRVNDGADSVGLKNWLVTLPASLSGYSEVNGVRSGKNLLNDSIRGNSGANIFFGHDTGVQNDFSVRLRAGTYTFSVVTADGTTTNLYIRNSDTSENIIGFPAYGVLSKTFTLAEDTNCAVFVYKSGYTSVTDILTAQIEVGSTATSYEAYEAPTQYTAELGRTIYGGTADIVTGEGEENCTNRNLVGTGFTWSYNTTELSFPYFTIGSNAPNKASNKNFVCDGYVNNGNYRSNLQDGEIGVYNNTSGINRFCVRDDSCTTLEQFLEKNANTKITYEVTTPETFTFTPITAETELGTNNFWAVEGNTELTYYKSGYGFTSVTIHKETPEGEPVEETRKLHRIIYEGQVDVISGTGLIYRGESGTQYDPPEQISFTPIEIATAEGENTLYADEGDSAITYRKAVE